MDEWMDKPNNGQEVIGEFYKITGEELREILLDHMTRSLVVFGAIQTDDTEIIELQNLLKKHVETLYSDDFVEFTRDDFMDVIQRIERLNNQTDQTEYLRESLHLATQRIGKKDEEKQLELFRTDDSHLLPVLPEGLEIKILGMQLTKSQEQVLTGIQTLLTRTGYRGHDLVDPDEDDQSGWNYHDKIPVLKVTFAEFLDACGCEKRKTGRGKMEYKSRDRDQIKNALGELISNQYQFYYKKHRLDNQGKTIPGDYTETRMIGTLIRIGEQIDYRKGLPVNKVLTIKPTPIVFDQIDTYKVFKPIDWLDEIKSKYPKCSHYFITFVNLLFVQFAHKSYTVRRHFKVLAKNLRMYKYIDESRWNLIRKEISKYYEMASDLGYLKSYEIGRTTKSSDVIVLNRDKFEYKKNQALKSK